MGYASQLGKSYNAGTAWNSLGSNSSLFGGYGAGDYARAPYNLQAFRNIVNAGQNLNVPRNRPIEFAAATPNGLFAFSRQPMEFVSEFKQIPNAVNIPVRMFDQLAGRYFNNLETLI